MQLNTKTDYAIRMVLYLAGHPGVTSAQELADVVEMPKQYVFSLFNELRETGLVASSRGVNGGFYLAKAADEVTLWDIAIITESSMQIKRSIQNEKKFNHVLPEYRVVDAVYKTVQQYLETTLKTASIAEILRCSGREPVAIPSRIAAKQSAG